MASVGGVFGVLVEGTLGLSAGIPERSSTRAHVWMRSDHAPCWSASASARSRTVAPTKSVSSARCR